MRVLHTSDWHVGKRLGRYDRMDEYAAAIDEVVAIGDSEGVDLAVVSGDLFDRPRPPVDALRLVLNGLVGLSKGGARPVVAVAGNHDSPELFDALAPFLAAQNIYLVGAIKAPNAGGVLELRTPAGPAAIACFPFLRQGRVVDFMAETGAWYGAYADRVRLICDAYASSLSSRDAVTILVAHFMVTGARLAGGPGRRGERELHIGQAYAAAESAVPRALSYVAMGHIHAPQPVPSANVPAEYAGSLLQLDFGEAGEQKRAVVVDARPGHPALVESLPLSAGRRLERAVGTWDELERRHELADAYLDLTVLTDGPDPELADKARAVFPYAVWVRADYDRPSLVSLERAGRTMAELYAEFCLNEYGAGPPEDVAAAFDELVEEAFLATA